MACSKCNKTTCTCTATLCTNPLIHTLDQAFSIIGTNYNGPQIGNTPVTTEHTIYTALYTVLNTGIVATNNQIKLNKEAEANQSAFELAKKEGFDLASAGKNKEAIAKLNVALTFKDDASVKAKIKELFSLAPQHNPANYEGIVVAENIFPNAKQNEG